MPLAPLARRLAPLASAALLACAPAHAATFNYLLAVTESQDAVVDAGGTPVTIYDLPDLGTAGTLTIRLDAEGFEGDPIPGEFEDISALLDVTASFGTLSTGLDTAFAQIFPRPGRAQFRNGSFSNLVVTGVPGGAFGTLAGSFSVSSAAFGSAEPATLGDVLAILSAPDAVAFLSFNGTADGEFVSFAARSDVAPVPLPAGGGLLLAGLGALALARWRR